MSMSMSMSSVQWLITTDLGEDSDVHAYAAAVRRSGAEVVEVPLQVALTPGALPDAARNRPTVVHGSVGFTQRIYDAGHWCPGVFGRPEDFSYDAWCAQYGPMLLNSPDGVLRTTPAGFIELYAQGQFADQTDVFVRPDQDTKSVVGAVWTPDAFLAHCHIVVQGGFEGIDANTGLLVCIPYTVEAEWRLFVVDGQVITGSQYHAKGRLHVARHIPNLVRDFAKTVCSRSCPARVFTLDVCTSAGSPYIMEVQGFNSAGVYAADLDLLMPRIHAVALDMFATR